LRAIVIAERLWWLAFQHLASGVFYWIFSMSHFCDEIEQNNGKFQASL
jgi:hypothetical protein